MDTFVIIILSVSSIVLILVGILMYIQYTSVDSTIYPPVEMQCPDNWQLHSDGTCIIPFEGVNTGTMKGLPIYRYKLGRKSQYTMLDSIYNMNTKSIMNGKLYPNVLGYYSSDIPHGYDPSNPQVNRVDFSDLGWNNYGSSLCEKRKWARVHNIVWDSVTNYNGCSQ